MTDNRKNLGKQYIQAYGTSECDLYSTANKITGLVLIKIITVAPNWSLIYPHKIAKKRLQEGNSDYLSSLFTIRLPDNYNNFNNVYWSIPYNQKEPLF